MDRKLIENLAEVDLETWQACEDHFAAHGFQSTHVIEEPLLSQQFVGVKIHICPPSQHHPFVVMFTSGMSDWKPGESFYPYWPEAPRCRI